MKSYAAALVLLFVSCMLAAQVRKEDMYSDFVLQRQRALMEKDLRQRVIAQTFSMPLDTNTEYRYASACAAIAQFQFSGNSVEAGFNTLFARYDSIEAETRAAFLEAVYTVTSNRYEKEVTALLNKETDARQFSICAAYLYRADSSANNSNVLKIKMVEQFPGYDTVPVLGALMQYLSTNKKEVQQHVPGVVELFKYELAQHRKVIYSFQRWNRDYPGVAVIQNADGKFAKDAEGKLIIVKQLARSGSGLPYFITNGNTPQGIYSIQGTAISRNHFIGPTPNLQMIMPFEADWEKYFHEGWQPGMDSMDLYRRLLPEGWRNYAPVMEAWTAGRVGRTEIIAHGSALDPEYFAGKPYYPLTPTMGCLCGKEIWSPETGRLIMSDQYELVHAFQTTEGANGLLIVVNLDNQQKPVGVAEIEKLIKGFENGER